LTEQILIGIASVIGLGVSAQWLAWKFKLPSILLLLVVGFLAGPVTGLLDPAALQGDWVFAFVSLAIGIILFEGGLNLRLSELGDIGRSVGNLITVGVLVTWFLAALAAHYVAGFVVPVAIVIGAILTVTGPTVVIPLLRQIRPSGRVGTVAKWEGITVDPVGAILAVLALETVIVLQGATSEGLDGVVLHAVEGLFKMLFTSVGVSVTAAFAIVFSLHRRLVPDYLENSVALMIVIAAYAISNVLQEESGLLTATLMGIFVANQRYASVRGIGEFKEDLQVLLIACLFILLSARLELDALSGLRGRALLFLALLILLIRPVAVFLSTIGTSLSVKERTFLAWLAPRGIVAAAVAALFAFRLASFYPQDAARLVPIVFLVIIGTVAIYGLSSGPLARWLKLAEPNPQGLLFLGAHSWAQRMARALHDLGYKVLLIDTNLRNVEQARLNGLSAERASALSESAIDELNLGGIGRILALTRNDEVNSLAMLNFSTVFESRNRYQLATGPVSGGVPHEMSSHVRRRLLFGEDVTFGRLSERFDRGGEISVFELTQDLTFRDLKSRFHGDLIPLFLSRDGSLIIFSEDEVTPRAGDSVVVFTASEKPFWDVADRTMFEELVDHAVVLDLGGAPTFGEVVRKTSARLAELVHLEADQVAKGFIEGARYGATLITRGVALPHFRVPDLERPEFAMVRCMSGVHIAFEDLHFESGDEPSHEETGPVFAFLFLMSPEENPRWHLRILASLANRVEDASFLDEWRDAENEVHLKEALLGRQ
jgi:NhaP-type Na+/H+ or K+/H+ antiporter/mannitol/fructose-specific phosphotransferase system IIA component (Ntr-type)